MKTTDLFEGVLVGCEKKLEWILPWWWHHYSKHNSYPIAFADFGMSDRARQWCQERGIYLTLPLEAFSPLQEVDPAVLRHWIHVIGEGVLISRPQWFLKPHACLQSPFTKTCWIDLDCEIKGSLEPLFNTLSLGFEIAIYKQKPSRDSYRLAQKGLYLPNEAIYNSGVIAFQSQTKIIQQWVELSIKDNKSFIGDQDVLSRVIHLNSPSLFPLSPFYNWPINRRPPPKVVILHYHGPYKTEILKQIHCK